MIQLVHNVDLYGDRNTKGSVLVDTEAQITPGTIFIRTVNGQCQMWQANFMIRKLPHGIERFAVLVIWENK